MVTVKLFIELPKELLERAAAVGLKIEDQSEAIAEALEREIKRREAAQYLLDAAEQLRSLPDELKPTPEEIEAEIAAFCIGSEAVRHKEG